MIEVITGLIAITVTTATPLLLAGFGELLVENSGVLNISVEAQLLLAAFSAYITTLFTESTWLGLLMACLSALLLNLLFGILTISFRLDQILVGISLNIMIMGLTVYIFRTLVGFRTAVPTVSNTIPQIAIPLLSSIPILSGFFVHNPFTYLALFVFPPLFYLLLYGTQVGLKIRAIGENPLYATFMGVDVNQYRYALLVLEGIMVGLAGSLYTIYINTLFLENMTGGKGFLVIALVILSAWNPVYLLPAALFFSFMHLLSYLFQAIGVQVPFQLALLLPYLAAIILLAIAGRKVKPPSSLAKPFERVR